jgi:hypothetical protein
MSDKPQPDTSSPPLEDVPPLDPLPETPPADPAGSPEHEATEGEPPTIPKDVPFIVPPGTQ